MDRLAHAIADYLWQTSPADLTAEWVAIAGPALAPESAFTERVSARREQRSRRNIRRAQREAAALDRSAQIQYEAIRRGWYEQALARATRNNTAVTASSRIRNPILQPLPTPQQYGLTPRVTKRESVGNQRLRPL